MLVIEKVCAGYEQFNLVDISFTAQKGEFFVVLGPTGAGKTLLLEAIAGLVQVRQGRILSGEKELTFLPPEQRSAGMVFQEYALFPHLNVFENISFGLRCGNKNRNPVKSEIENRVVDIAHRMKISHLLNRVPSSLSGGEKQRTALARALVIEPEMLLLDEPLSALDARTKRELKGEIRAIVRDLNVPVIYVTHDQQEAFALGDRVAIMNGGRILQVGEPEQVFYSPASEFVARFLGVKNIFEGVVTSNVDGLASIKIGEKEVEAICAFNAGVRVKVCIRPENVIVSCDAGKASTRNLLRGKIAAIESRGATASVRVGLSDFELEALLTKRSVEDLDLTIGKDVNASFKATGVHVFKAEG